jgi:hypothetical protein
LRQPVLDPNPSYAKTHHHWNTIAFYNLGFIWLSALGGLFYKQRIFIFQLIARDPVWVPEDEASVLLFVLLPVGRPTWLSR